MKVIYYWQFKQGRTKELFDSGCDYELYESCFNLDESCSLTLLFYASIYWKIVSSALLPIINKRSIQMKKGAFLVHQEKVIKCNESHYFSN